MLRKVFLVEDETVIREGLRDRIPWDQFGYRFVGEAADGEMALPLIRKTKPDVLITDIKMPFMDGLSLSKIVSKEFPRMKIIIISGYDDFAYAVEMLRNGVREYILKPIEREKITEILKKLNAEIESRKEKEENNQKIGYQQMRHLMLSDEISGEEQRTIESQYADHFYTGNYYVCCQNQVKRGELSDDNYIFMKNMNDNDIFIVPAENLSLLLKNELQDGYIGISAAHCGLESIRQAYAESVMMRKKAFVRNKVEAQYGVFQEKIPEGLITEAAKLTEEAARIQRVQLIGTDHTDDLEKSFHQFFYEVKNGRIDEAVFESCMKDFFTEVEKTYQNALETEGELLLECKEIWSENCIDSYEDKVMEFVLQLHEKINSSYDQNKNVQKIKMAVDYIEENYAKDLNMAVVSNYISMNYSLFSYSFKQYTGSNFVNYLKEIRMREAKKLLTETDMKIIEISQAVGYDNEKHFMKIFKATCGVSPTEYRHNAYLSKS
mgnify:CR=1 FL=1